MRTRLVTGLLLLFAGAVSAAAQIEVTARVDRNDVTLGERVILTVEAAGAQNVPPPDLGTLDQSQVQYLGPSTQVSIVNGQVSARTSHVYALTPRQTGRMTLGPFRVDYEGKSYQTSPITVQVTAQGQAPAQAKQGSSAKPGGSELWLEVQPAKTDVFVGERLPLVVKLFVGRTRVDQVQYPKIGGEGYATDQLSQPRQTEENVQGRRVHTVRFDTAITPLRPGPLDLAPTMDMAVLENRRRGPFGDSFDDFFAGAFADRRPVQVQAAPVTVNVHPLPEVGKPDGFGGAVGKFDFILDAKPTELNAGDPITVRMRIEGTGNLGTIEAPAIPVDERFRAYAPLAAKGEEDAQARVFEQVVIPKDAGIHELPPIRFSYFDPEARGYRTITRGPLALTIRPPAASAEPQVIGREVEPEPQRPVEKLGRDIVYIKDAPDRFRARGAGMYRQSWFWGLQLLPVAGYVALTFSLRRRERLAADPRLVRFRHAGREAKQALDALSKQPGGGAEFYDGLAAALNAYLSAKLDLPPGAIESDRVLARLGHDGPSDDVRRQVQSIFAVIERARYAPSAASATERETALQLARDVVERLERQRGLLHGLRMGVFILPLLALIPFAHGEDAVDPNTTFFEGNAAYKAGHYDEAARAYERVLVAGLKDGALLFNLGNAYVKNGRIGPAVLSYERARELLPRDADVRANLAYARELAAEPVPEPSLWERIILPLAQWATSDQLALVLSACWFVLWAVLSARLLVPRVRVTLGRAAWAVGFFLLFVSASFAARVATYDLNRPAIVTAAGKTPVRFEPSTTGTEHFQVGEGAWVDVTETRDDWVQIRRADGRRGWLPSNTVTEIEQ